jgi:hypothetical protein
MGKKIFSQPPSEAFHNIRLEKQYFKETLADIMQKEYDLAKQNNWDLSSSRVQENICSKFLSEVTPERIDTYCQGYDGILSDRERKLKSHVIDLVTQIENFQKYDNNTKRSVKYNQDLRQKNYLKVIARYKETKTLREIIVPITQESDSDDKDDFKNYLSEDEMDKLIEDPSKKYLPSFKDIDSQYDISKLDIVSKSNITVLYDKKKLRNDNEEISFEELNKTKAVKYTLYSRSKNHYRQTQKLVDHLLDLRPENKEPYDDIGVIVEVPDGDSMYNILNYLISTSSTYPEIDNSKTHKQNVKKTDSGNIVLKLRNDYYSKDSDSHRICDPSNLKAVMHQIYATKKNIDRKIKELSKSNPNETYKLTKDETEQLKQGLKIGHTLDNFKCETYVMTPKMLEEYFYGAIGYNNFFNKREDIRNKYLVNPAESPKNKELMQPKVGKKGKIKDTYIQTSEDPPKVDIIADFLEQLFIPAYQWTKYEEQFNYRDEEYNSSFYENFVADQKSQHGHRSA